MSNNNDIMTELAEGKITVEEAIELLVAINKTEVALQWTGMKF